MNKDILTELHKQAQMCGKVGKTSELKEEPFITWMANGRGEIAYTDDNGKTWYKYDKGKYEYRYSKYIAQTGSNPCALP
jgi:photosystem II stability/assembly factor-like uncharacterized protein